MVRKKPVDKKRELIKARKILRDKLKFIKNERQHTSHLYKTQFQPITEPLETLVKTIKAEHPVKQEIKTENIGKSGSPPRELPHIPIAEDVFSYTPEPDTSLEEVKQAYSKDENVRKSFEDTINQFGKDIQHYLRKMVADTSGVYDHIYGIRYENGWKIGDSPVEIDGDDFIINGVRYKGSPGLYELMFLKIPNQNIYTTSDLEKYKAIVFSTNAMRRKYSRHERVNANRGYKYTNVIAKLFPIEDREGTPSKGLKTWQPRRRAQSTTGSGMQWKKVSNSNVQYVFWNTADELVDRLRILLAERIAGNNSPNIQNEIINIESELREEKIIA